MYTPVFFLPQQKHLRRIRQRRSCTCKPCNVSKTWLWLKPSYIFIREPSKSKVFWRDKWNNSEDVVFLKSRRRRMWYPFVDRYSHICHMGTGMPDMVDLPDTTEHRTCNSIPSPPGNIASAPKHKDDRDCSSFTVHKKQKFKKMFWWLQDWEVWSQKILCISFLVIHHHVLASLHPSVGQSLCKSCNVRTYYTIFLSQTY